MQRANRALVVSSRSDSESAREISATGELVVAHSADNAVSERNGDITTISLDAGGTHARRFRVPSTWKLTSCQGRGTSHAVRRSCSARSLASDRRDSGTLLTA